MYIYMHSIHIRFYVLMIVLGHAWSVLVLSHNACIARDLTRCSYHTAVRVYNKLYKCVKTAASSAPVIETCCHDAVKCAIHIVKIVHVLTLTTTSLTNGMLLLLTTAGH
jgi:hypothetical protein